MIAREFRRILLLAIIFCLALVGSIITKTHHDFAKILKSVDDAMANVTNRWQVDQFPVFLRTAWMLEPAFHLMRDRFQLKILSALISGNDSLVISFTGSSVTAGHDHQFSLSYPVLIGKFLTPIFESLAISLTVRNVAMGNNPCMPYDVCVQTFAGRDAEIVVWEQSYNCNPGNKGYLYEQFIRQAMMMPTKPLIAFSDSSTPNWHPASCINQSTEPAPLTPEERTLLAIAKNGQVRHILVDKNKINERHWGRLVLTLMQHYPAAGVQTFLHSLYEQYRCRGPYIADWKNRNVMWHPSLLGHELRAAHFSFNWLVVLKEAVQNVIRLLGGDDMNNSMIKSAATAHRELCVKLGSPGPSCEIVNKDASLSHDAMPNLIHTNVNLTDDIQCYTDYLPRPDASTADTMSLKKLSISSNIIPPLSNSKTQLPYLPGWTSITFEYIYFPELVNKTSAAGYLDFKVVLYGNNFSQPLHLTISVRKIGKWNFMWFMIETARQLSYFGSAVHSDDRCIQSEDYVEPGSYVLSIVPLDLKYVVISTLLVP